MMDRRSFLRLLGGAATVTAAGLVLPYEPQRVYSFLTDNPPIRTIRRKGSIDSFSVATSGLAWTFRASRVASGERSMHDGLAESSPDVSTLRRAGLS